MESHRALPVRVYLSGGKEEMSAAHKCQTCGVVNHKDVVLGECARCAVFRLTKENQEKDAMIEIAVSALAQITNRCADALMAMKAKMKERRNA